MKRKQDTMSSKEPCILRSEIELPSYSYKMLFKFLTEVCVVIVHTGDNLCSNDASCFVCQIFYIN